MLTLYERREIFAIKYFYKQKLNVAVSFSIVFLVFGTAFWYLQQGLLFSELSLPIAGCIVLFAVFGKKGFPTLFHSPKEKSKNFFLTVFLSYLASMIYSFVLVSLMHFMGISTSANPLTESISGEEHIYLVKDLILPAIQIVGEELLTIIPLILIINVLLRFGVNDRITKVFTILATSLLFGALHLSTYNWNLIQCLLVIGIGRIPNTLATMKQDTLWAGITSHILFDWTLFFMTSIT